MILFSQEAIPDDSDPYLNWEEFHDLVKPLMTLEKSQSSYPNKK